MNRRRIGIISAGVAHGLAWAVLLYLAFWPCIYVGTTATLPGDVTTTESVCKGTLVSVNGMYVLLVLAVPLAITGLGLFATLSTDLPRFIARMVLWVSAILLILACLLGALSIGIIYIPSALAMIVAAIAGPRKTEPSPQT